VSPLPVWGAVCFFGSGAAALLYEVVWSKQLAYLLGSSLHSVATVVAAFLCGLALGARVLGVPLARRGRGARTYALLEIGVAALGLALLPVLRAIDPLVGELYRGLGGEAPAFALARFALLFALLVPPAALMGATLPVLVAHFEHDLVGSALARLYALNTFGAVAGSVAGGFALLPGLGLAGTTGVAAALNVAVAALAWKAGRQGQPLAARPPAPDPAIAPAGPEPEAPRRGALAGGARLTFALLFALSGFAALVFQIAWVRLYSLAFGSSVYSFSAVLGVYLFGLALGSAAVSRIVDRGASLAGFARLQLALAVVTALAVHAFPRLPEWMYELGVRSGPRWGALLVGEVGLAAALLLVPCALLGAVFPIATRILQRSDGGHAVGFGYAVNTAGTIAGSLVAGFFAVPTWGVQGTHVAAMLVSLAIGLVALVLARARREAGPLDLAGALATVAVVGGLVTLAPRWDTSLMTAGPFRPIQAANLGESAQMAGGFGPTIWRATRIERVLYYREGVNGSVVVGTNDLGRGRWLRVGGKIDASTGDMDTQVLVGLIPAALADSGARALVVGLGSGMTAAATLAGGAGATDVVELEQGVVEASRFFHGPGENPLDDPRVTLFVGDARTHLAHGAGLYDLIVSQPSNPWIAGMNNLFTVDFYRRVKTRLEPDGVFCQWLQLYEVSPKTFASLVASFLEVFPDGHLFAVWRAVDLLFIAAPSDRALDLARLRSPAVRRILERTNVPAPEALAAYYAAPLSALRPIAQGAVLNRDDRPVVEYRAARDLVEVGNTNMHGHPEVTGRVPFTTDKPPGPLFADWPTPDWLVARVRYLLREGQRERAAAAATAARAAGIPGIDDLVAAERRRLAALEQVDQARVLLAMNRVEAGRRALEQAVEVDPSNGLAWATLANERLRAGDLEGAEQAIARARTSDEAEPRAEAAVVAGRLESTRRRPLAAASQFAEAQRWMPRVGRNYVLEAEALRAAGDLPGARDAVRRGLALLPGDPRLTATQAALGSP